MALGVDGESNDHHLLFTKCVLYVSLQNITFLKSWKFFEKVIKMVFDYAYNEMSEDWRINKSFHVIQHFEPHCLSFFV